VSATKLQNTILSVVRSNPWNTASGILIVMYGLIILLTFHDYGITSDETHHVKYGADIAQWYLSEFEDQALFALALHWAALQLDLLPHYFYS
jgi:hypothetical protein